MLFAVVAALWRGPLAPFVEWGAGAKDWVLAAVSGGSDEDRAVRQELSRTRLLLLSQGSDLGEVLTALDDENPSWCEDYVRLAQSDERQAKRYLRDLVDDQLVAAGATGSRRQRVLALLED